MPEVSGRRVHGACIRAVGGCDWMSYIEKKNPSILQLFWFPLLGWQNWQAKTDTASFWLLTITVGRYDQVLLNELINSWHTEQFSRHSGIMLCICPTNERRRYIVTSSLIGWAHTRTDPWHLKYCWCTTITRNANNAPGFSFVIKVADMWFDCDNICVIMLRRQVNC